MIGRNGSRRLAAGLLLACACVLTERAAATGAAQGSAAETIERQRLATQRSRIEAEHEARERECAERFAVTACLEENRDQRRRALEAVDARRAALDDRQRARRAAARERRIEAKTARRAKAALERASEPLPTPASPVITAR